MPINSIDKFVSFKNNQLEAGTVHTIIDGIRVIRVENPNLYESIKNHLNGEASTVVDRLILAMAENDKEQIDSLSKEEQPILESQAATQIIYFLMKDMPRSSLDDLGILLRLHATANKITSMPDNYKRRIDGFCINAIEEFDFSSEEPDKIKAFFDSLDDSDGITLYAKAINAYRRKNIEEYEGIRDDEDRIINNLFASDVVLFLSKFAEDNNDIVDQLKIISIASRIKDPSKSLTKKMKRSQIGVLVRYFTRMSHNPDEQMLNKALAFFESNDMPESLYAITGIACINQDRTRLDRIGEDEGRIQKDVYPGRIMNLLVSNALFDRNDLNLALKYAKKRIQLIKSTKPLANQKNEVEQLLRKFEVKRKRINGLSKQEKEEMKGRINQAIIELQETLGVTQPETVAAKEQDKKQIGQPKVGSRKECFLESLDVDKTPEVKTKQDEGFKTESRNPQDQQNKRETEILEKVYKLRNLFRNTVPENEEIVLETIKNEITDPDGQINSIPEWILFAEINAGSTSKEIVKRKIDQYIRKKATEAKAENGESKVTIGDIKLLKRIKEEYLGKKFKTPTDWKKLYGFPKEWSKERSEELEI